MGLFGRRKAKKGDKPPVRYVWSQNMQLHVAAPTGADWELTEAGSADDLLAAVRCLCGEPPEALALNAYAYRVPPDQQRTVEQLCAQDWAARWAGSAFARVDTAAAEPDERSGTERACLVVVDGRGRAEGAPLRVVERHTPAGSRLLVASAAGPPSLHQALAPTIDLWLTHAALGN